MAAEWSAAGARPSSALQVLAAKLCCTDHPYQFSQAAAAHPRAFSRPAERSSLSILHENPPVATVRHSLVASFAVLVLPSRRAPTTMGAPKKKGSGGKKKPARAPQQVRDALARPIVNHPVAHRPSGPATCMHRHCHHRPHVCMRRPLPPPLFCLRLQLTAEEHFENAEMAFAMENFELARTSFKRALDMEPEVGLRRRA